MSSYTTDAARFWLGSPGSASIRDAWGTFLNANASLIASATTGLATVSLAGLVTYSLTALNAAADQSRPLMQDYTGAIPGACTVTLPNVQKTGWARNSTTGGFNVLLTSGGGTQATILPDGLWYPYWCDGGANVVVLGPGVQSLKVVGALTVGGAVGITGNLTVGGAGAITGKLTAEDGATGDDVVNISQFPQFLEGSSGYVGLPSGFILNFGTATSDFVGQATVTFKQAYPSGCFGVVAMVQEDASIVCGRISKSTTGCLIRTNTSSSGAVSGGRLIAYLAWGN